MTRGGRRAYLSQLVQDRAGETALSSKWYIEFRDHRRTVRRIAGFTSKAATEELGRNLVRLSAYVAASGGQCDPALESWVAGLDADKRKKLADWGLLDRGRVAVYATIDEHLKDYIDAIRSRGNTDGHVTLSESRVRRVLDACGFRGWDDITAECVQKLLGELGLNDLCAALSNFGVNCN